MPVTGFSLMELMVVMALAGLMMTIVPPLFSGAIETAERKAAARELAAALKKVRNKAIAEQTASRLVVDLDKKRYGGDSGRTKQLPDHLHMSLFTARTERISEHRGGIRFFPDGTSTGGRITLTNGPRKAIVDVDWLTGMVRIDETQ